jgi:hypothetical protein
MTTVKSVPSVSRLAEGNSSESRAAAIAVGMRVLTAVVGTIGRYPFVSADAVERT